MEVGVIEKGIERDQQRPKRGQLTALLRALKTGESFVWHESKRNSIYMMARLYGVSVSLNKIADGYVRVFCVDEAA